MELAGVYFHDGFEADPPRVAPLHWSGDEWLRQLRWLQACGIGAVEFATMLEFNRLPSTPLERRKIADRLRILDRAHRLGMKFGYLLTNTVVSTVPEGEEPGHQFGGRAKELCPRDPVNYRRTMDLMQFWLRTFREADWFEQFAADWGGCQCGRCGVPEYLRYVRDGAEALRDLNGRALLYANTWCISYWRKDPLANGWRGVFDEEIRGSRAVIDALPDLPPNVHLGLPCHHLYRPLAFEAYGGRARTPRFPAPTDVQRVATFGRHVLAWPHFVMDDDPAREPAWGIVHCEVRYLQAVLRALAEVGVRRVMGNLYLPWLQLPNTYALGRFAADVDTAPERVLAEFSQAVATREDASALTDVLVWLENNSYWQRQMPADGREPDLPSTLDRATAARLAARVRARARPSLPLPLPAEEWLDALRRSIGRMTWAA